MKSRMLKPSILLPLGTYFVSSAHYSMLVEMFGKERHGLRERDLNHKDKQNFDAVLHMIRASHLLKELPEAVGTMHYVNVIKECC